jgi:bifunctional NMN adenylyltransferase/nudix hydrolase
MYTNLKKYKEDYGPGPHLAADAVVVCRHYILLVTRKNGTLALPGGFVNPGETTRDAAIRECLEETSFDVKKHFVNQGRNLYRRGFLFDNPRRDPRNHVVTVAHYLPCQTDEEKMPVVLGKDGVSEARWYSLMNLSSIQNSFFADHYKIISKVIHSV